MGYHEQCIKCGADMCDGVDAGEICRKCLKGEIARLKAEVERLREQVAGLTDTACERDRVKCRHVADVWRRVDALKAALAEKDGG